MELSDTDRALIAAVQDGLPLVAHPYAEVARQLGTSEADVMAGIASLLERGLIKRMGVVVRHRALGYRANAMVVWNVPDENIEQIGRLLSGETYVTLCYQRPRRLPHWPYNLFCMIHGRSRASVRRCLETMIEAHGLHGIEHEVLFSTRAFKQCGARYGKFAMPQEPAGSAHG